MNRVIFNQILGTFMSLFIFAVFTFMAVVSKNIIIIISSIILGILTLLFTLNSIKVIKKEKGIKIKHDFNYGIIIGLIFILSMFGAFLSLLINNISYRINGIETTATVYDINKKVSYKTEYDENGNSYEEKKTRCDVYIKYNVENIEYKSKLDVSSCKYSNGDKVKIYYDKNNPSNFASNSISILIFATLFTGSGLAIFIIKWIKSSNRKKKDSN